MQDFEEVRNRKMNNITSKKRISTQDITIMALLTALLCISSYIIIPLPFTAITITAQTLVINMIGLLMTPKKAGTIVGMWIALGIIGLPVFSGGMGGIGQAVRSNRRLYFRLSGSRDTDSPVKRQKRKRDTICSSCHCSRHAGYISIGNGLDESFRQHGLERCIRIIRTALYPTGYGKMYCSSHNC